LDAVQGVLKTIEERFAAAAADSGEQTITPPSEKAKAGAGGSAARRRDPVASLSVRQPRLLLQQLDVDSSGCLEKEELVEKVAEAGRKDVRAPALIIHALQAQSTSQEQQQRQQEMEQPGSSGSTVSAPPPLVAGAGGSTVSNPPPPVAGAGGSTSQQRSPPAGLAGCQPSGQGVVEPAAALAAAPSSHKSGDSSSRPSERRCARCGASPGEAIKLRPCACRLVRYCGERCQGEDWAGHKAACREARRRQRQEEGGAA
jgi:hypothetical protein